MGLGQPLRNHYVIVAVLLLQRDIKTVIQNLLKLKTSITLTDEVHSETQIACIHVLMRRKEERSKQGQTNNKAKQHSTPKAVTFPKKNELPRVGHVYVHVRCKIWAQLHVGELPW